MVIVVKLGYDNVLEEIDHILKEISGFDDSFTIWIQNHIVVLSDLSVQSKVTIMLLLGTSSFLSIIYCIVLFFRHRQGALSCLVVHCGLLWSKGLFLTFVEQGTEAALIYQSLLSVIIWGLPLQNIPLQELLCQKLLLRIQYPKRVLSKFTSLYQRYFVLDLLCLVWSQCLKLLTSIYFLKF